MARIALINAGVVENVIDADLSFALSMGYDDAIESPGACVGDLLDGKDLMRPTNRAVNPPVLGTLPRPRHITQHAFRTRVTDSLIARMELAAMHNPADREAIQLAKAERRASMARCFAASYVDLDLEELQAAFAMVPEADFKRIFANEVQEIERP